MKRVAKLILVNNDDEHLMLYRSDHPFFPGDPDLPGGTLNENEEPIPALIREVSEETGVVLDKKVIEKLRESNTCDKGYTYYLYRATCGSEPDISISWEHDRYEWLTLNNFIIKTHTANDKYMHMVYDYLSRNNSRPVH